MERDAFGTAAGAGGAHIFCESTLKIFLKSISMYRPQAAARENRSKCITHSIFFF